MIQLILALFLITYLSTSARAQVLGVEVRNGDIYVHLPNRVGRLTHDGDVVEATLSRDRNLIAYVRKGSLTADSSSLDDLYLCSAPQRYCVLAVHGVEQSSTQTNLAGINNVRFSLQAGERSDGRLLGSLFFLSDAGGANTDTVHRVPFGGRTIQQMFNVPAPFVTYANSLEVIQSGRYAGALSIEQVQYTAHGACGAAVIFDPNTKKALQNGASKRLLTAVTIRKMNAAST